MGLTTVPPRIQLYASPSQPPSSPALLLPLAVAFSLLLIAFAGSPFLARPPHPTALTRVLIAKALDQPDKVRLTVRLYVGPGATAATYAFVQLNGPDEQPAGTCGLESATDRTGMEVRVLDPGERTQQRLLLRLLSLDQSSWHPLSNKRWIVRPRRRAEITLFSPGGELIGAGEVSDLDRSGPVQSLLEYLQNRRATLLLPPVAPPHTIATHISPQDPVDS